MRPCWPISIRSTTRPPPNISRWSQPGGYGRGTLAPGSDVDLLFLLPYKQTAWGESMVEAILYILWDLKLKVGHATRSVDECVREAKADMTIRTALLETRFITGDEALFADLVARFDRQIVRGTSADFVEAKLRERDARVAKAGASRYLVEPNVKDGKGGLRDLNTLFWIAKYVYRVREPIELVKAGLFTAEEFALFARCEEFLWRVRCHMHFTTGRAEERLSFDLQRRITETIGYAPRDGQASVERFMKGVFPDRQGGRGPDSDRLRGTRGRARPSTGPCSTGFFGTLSPRAARRSDAEDFRVDTDRITVAGDDAFERDPVNLIRLFWLADRPQPRGPSRTRRGSRRARSS
jgi:[protein-PII] uridylyltransferase